MKELFTVNELAEHFRVNPKTIPAFKVGKVWRIARKNVIWLKR
jgi:hypothetical protein